MRSIITWLWEVTTLTLKILSLIASLPFGCVAYFIGEVVGMCVSSYKSGKSG